MNGSIITTFLTEKELNLICMQSLKTRTKTISFMMKLTENCIYPGVKKKVSPNGMLTKQLDDK